MNIEKDEKSKLLAQLTKLLVLEGQLEKVPDKALPAILQQLEIMNERLTAIESRTVIDSISLAPLQLVPHPSQERFQISEANELLLPNTNEKACRFEPDKPCDYCSMCSSHGF